MAESNPHYTIDTIFSWRYGNRSYYATVALLFFISLAGVLIRGDLFRARWGFVAVALALLPALAEYVTGIRFPWPMKFLLSLALVLHMAGGIFLFYFTLYPIYDKICHLVSAMAIAFLIFTAILVIGGITGKNFPRKPVVACVFVTVILFGLMWEYAELFLDVLSGTSYFVNPYDSFFDVIFNIIGTSYITLNINEYLKRESLPELYRRWIRWKTA